MFNGRRTKYRGGGQEKGRADTSTQGTRGAQLQMSFFWKTRPLPKHDWSRKYVCSSEESDLLNEELRDVSKSLDLDTSTSKLYQLPSGLYVHTYSSTLRCSSLSLEKANHFFDFVVAIEQLPVTTIDTKSFHYGNDDLVRLDETSTVSDIVACEGSDEGEYACRRLPGVGAKRFGRHACCTV